jgi:hypothetical protein
MRRHREADDLGAGAGAAKGLRLIVSGKVASPLLRSSQVSRRPGSAAAMTRFQSDGETARMPQG